MIKKPYEYSPYEVYEKRDIDVATALMIEGYALACADVIRMLSGDSPCSKSYDPMSINGMVASSYAFELKDSGRKHDLTLFKNVGEIMECLLKETKDLIEKS